ncbi:MAG TPA: glycosyltransferase family 4 protein [Longimicrobiales bacterium]
MSRLHFLVPGPIDRRTGGTIYDARIVAELRRLGHDVVVHELNGRFPWPDRTARAAAARAFEVCATGEVTIVDGLALAALDPTAPPPPATVRVLLVHMPLDEERGLPYGVRVLLRAAENAWLRRADRIVCTSGFVARRLARRGANAAAVAVVEPGVDRARTAPRGSTGAAPPADGTDAGAGPTRWPGAAGPPGTAPAEPVRLLAVGAVTRVKAHGVLVRALRRLEHLPWTLEIVGNRSAEPATADTLSAEIDRAGLAGRIRLAGELPVDRLHEAYRRADLFVLPSLYESYGMALAEAAAHGLALVASRAGGIPATPAGRAALLVPPGDDAALARALEPLLADATARARLAAAARDASRRLRSWADAGRDFVAQLAAVRAPAGP